MNIQNAFYGYVLNPVMRALLRSRFHTFASRNLGILCYRGRKSGRAFETPLSYVREGQRIAFLSSHATRWWTNFRAGPTAVEILAAGEVLSGKARVWEEDCDALRDGVRRFLSALPRDAKVYGIGLDGERKPRETDLASAAGRLVLVEVELDAAPD
jgi:hypothetical protein